MLAKPPELRLSDRRMGDQDVIDPSRGENLRLGEGGGGQTNSAVGHLPPRHFGTLVRLGVWPQLDAMVCCNLSHAGQVSLHHRLIHDRNRRDGSLAGRQRALEDHRKSRVVVIGMQALML